MNNVELAYIPYYSSWLNQIEPQFTALRYFALDGTDHPSHKAQGPSQHDPPLHHLAQSPHHRPETAQGHPPRLTDQAGKGCLTRY
ncbi:hypothetical protein E9229_003721 [Paeniglutamicibacter cryotolerans]|uniref:Tc1-like transposase DDE domain-containing protein n=1 Tax=Paeniglutamicibacter cryotolerans TaxID=670079 RepID=A0A839QRR9_9MICC|nr:hypothetical protein [Paeniglutamicibacter cryotolerans]